MIVNSEKRFLPKYVIYFVKKKGSRRYNFHDKNTCDSIQIRQNLREYYHCMTVDQEERKMKTSIFALTLLGNITIHDLESDMNKDYFIDC